jgi:hypothetical protein
LWEGRCWGKGVEGWIRCNKMCTHVYKCKPIPDETTTGVGGRWRRIVEEVNSCMIHCYIVRTCVNATMYPTHHNNKGKQRWWVSTWKLISKKPLFLIFKCRKYSS